MQSWIGETFVGHQSSKKERIGSKTFEQSPKIQGNPSLSEQRMDGGKRLKQLQKNIVN